MAEVKLRGVQIGRLYILVGFRRPRLHKYRGKLPGSWLHPDDRFLGYDGYLGGEPIDYAGRDRDGGVE